MIKNIFLIASLTGFRIDKTKINANKKKRSYPPGNQNVFRKAIIITLISFMSYFLYFPRQRNNILAGCIHTGAKPPFSIFDSVGGN